MQVPQPCVAVCLLFPSTKITGPRRAELLAKRTAGAAAPPADLFFLQQHDGIGNACGTIACVHAVAAGATTGAFSLCDGVLKRFIDATASSSAAERGWKLTETTELQEMSDATAAAGETQGAGTDDAMDSHFIAFVQRAGARAL
jgi:ubiquitin carboxyl-terminal hydrolase L3